MVSTFTPYLNLEEPARGDQVGTWDTPVNSNMTVLDKVAGGLTVISLNNSPVVLSAAQYQNRTIAFNSTLTGSVTITFPTSFVKDYVINNVCTGSSAFVITLTCTAPFSNSICCPPGVVLVINGGVSGGMTYLSLDRAGTYWDYAGSSVPAWVSGCTIPPFLNCDGSAFSAATYPALAVILGGTTLPDARGRYRATLNQTTGRITSGTSLGGVDGNTAFASGGAQVTTLSSQQIPPVKVTDLGHVHSYSGPVLSVGAGPSGTVVGSYTATNTGTALTGITVGSSNPTVVPLLPPTYIGGITMIRAG